MRRLKFLFVAALTAGCLLFGGSALSAQAATDYYYIGGMTAGFSLSAGGVEIVGFKEVVSEQGAFCPATEAGMRTGDLIVAVDGIHTRSIEELNAAFARSKGKCVRITLKREGEHAEIDVTPVREKNSEKYKIGILIRDTLSGIGTVTYIEKDSLRFGALGHAVCAEDRTALTIADSSVYLCSIVSVNRGERGKAGELRGLFMNDSRLGAADKVCARRDYTANSRTGTTFPPQKPSRLRRFRRRRSGRRSSTPRWTALRPRRMRLPSRRWTPITATIKTS